MTTAEQLARRLCKEKRDELQKARTAVDFPKKIDVKTLPMVVRKAFTQIITYRQKIQQARAILTSAGFTVSDEGEITRRYGAGQVELIKLREPYTAALDRLAKIETKICVDLYGIDPKQGRQLLEALRKDLDALTPKG